MEQERLPQGEEERKPYATPVGADGWRLLAALDGPPPADGMKTLPALTTLRQSWAHQVAPLEQGGGWLAEPVLPGAELINSADEPEARAGGKRPTFWVGDQVHCSHTWDEEAPPVITQGATTQAACPAGQALACIHAGEAERSVLPKHQLVDAGSVDSATLIQSREQPAVDLVGPTRKKHWSQAETGSDLTHFSMDWEAETLPCPQGHRRATWTPAQNRSGLPLIKIKCAQTDGKAGPSQADCTSSTRRTLTWQPREQLQALIAARQREGTTDFKALSRHRAGIEGLHSQATRTRGLRRSRYLGLRKTHLGHVAMATAVTVVHLLSWLRGAIPAQPRTSPFKPLLKQAA